MAFGVDDFEAPIRDLLRELESLNGFYPDEATRLQRQQLEEKLTGVRRQVFAKLTAWLQLGSLPLGWPTR